MPEAGFVTLQVYDILGRSVRTIDLGLQQAGEQNTVFEANNLSSGVYMYRVQVEYQGSGQKEASVFGRMVFLK